MVRFFGCEVVRNIYVFYGVIFIKVRLAGGD